MVQANQFVHPSMAGGVLHLTHEEVAECLDDILDQHWRQVVEGHMRDCPPCRERVRLAQQDLAEIHDTR